MTDNNDRTGNGNEEHAGAKPDQPTIDLREQLPYPIIEAAANIMYADHVVNKEMTLVNCRRAMLNNPVSAHLMIMEASRQTQAARMADDLKHIESLTKRLRRRIGSKEDPSDALDEIIDLAKTSAQRYLDFIRS